MKFAATLFAVAAAAATADKRDTVFSVSDFSAGCVRHSTQCVYSFSVIQPGTMETTGVKCSASGPAGAGGELPEIKDGACEGSRTFTVAKGADGLTLTVTQPVTPSSNQSGSHLLAKADLKTTNEPNAVVQNYVGPKSFNLE